MVLLGDSQTGKSSLIASLLAEEDCTDDDDNDEDDDCKFETIDPDDADKNYPEEIPSIYDEFFIPASATGGEAHLVVIDTNSSLQDKQVQENAIISADVIGLLYSFDEPSSFAQIESKWLPLIRQLQQKSADAMSPLNSCPIPIIIVGNKSDLYLSTTAALYNTTRLLTSSDIATCLTCSVKMQENVSELWWGAIQAALVFIIAKLIRFDAR
jgi:GTPase SAR1 family protein